MNIKNIHSSLLVLVLSLNVSAALASDNSVNLTTDVIQSAERCQESGRATSELSCKTYMQTTNYTCGPAAVMTLMNYYGKLDKSQMNHQTEMKIASEMGATDAGTTPSQVESWLSNQGMHVDSGQRITTDMLIHNIQKGIPTLVAYNDHWLLAKGFTKGKTPDQDEIIFSDSCCHVTVITRETIDSMWIQSQMPSNHCRGNLGEYITATN